jgi:tRNA-2-methylthio-N6-dimethylallyladenosine synthase
VFGPQTLHRLPQLLAQRSQTGKAQVDIRFPEIEKFDHLPPPRKEGVSAFVSIMEGCSTYCSFCVVPYTRGAEYSRDVNKILDEVKALIDKDVKEIYLLGQNVNAYHGLDENKNSTNLAKLIEKIAEFPQIQRIRYTTSHPRDMDNSLIEAHRDIEKLMPFLHLPVQAGSNAVLKAMNRKHTRQDYFKIIEKLRKAKPDMGLSSDFIVGFPGESDQDFEDTLDLVKQIGFAQCYSFKYSPRQGTPSADSIHQVAEEVKVTFPPSQKVVGPEMVIVGVLGFGLTVTIVAVEAEELQELTICCTE